MTGILILIFTILTFLVCIGILVGGNLYLKNKLNKGGIELVWNDDDHKLKNLWEDTLPKCREVFDSVGAEYGFWRAGDFLKISGYMKIEVQRKWLDLGPRGLAAGITIAGKKHIKLCLVLPKRDPTTKEIVGENMMGEGAPWDGALIHEMNHFAYEYLYKKFDYNHAAEGDGIGGTNGCWTHDHDLFIEDVQATLRAKFSKV